MKYNKGMETLSRNVFIAFTNHFSILQNAVKQLPLHHVTRVQLNLCKWSEAPITGVLLISALEILEKVYQNIQDVAHI